MGGGCCDNGFGCTVLSGTNYCAATTGTGSAIRTGSNGILATGSSDVNSTSNNRGLSTGAKAGIGVAVALLVLACVGACIYFFTIHRRRALHSNSSSHRDADNPPAAMSQLSGSRISHKSESKAGSKISRPGVSPRGRQGSDYFGMTTAPSGPFTESAGTSPGLASRGGVPATPQSPSDIAAPVEIGGEGMETRREEGNASVATTPGGGWEYVKREKFRERIAELEITVQTFAASESHDALPPRSIPLGAVVQAEGGCSLVALGATDGVGDHDQVVVGEQVGSGLVAGWGNLLGDEELETVVLAGDPESAGGVDAGSSPLWDVWESSVGVAGDEGGALYTGGLHGTGLDDGEGVAGWEALGAVWDAAGAEVGDIEDAAALLDGGGRCKSNGDGRDNGR
ncbi:hypothetical protein ACHAPF_006342 [Botrytis cinerea]